MQSLLTQPETAGLCPQAWGAVGGFCARVGVPPGFHSEKVARAALREGKNGWGQAGGDTVRPFGEAQMAAGAQVGAVEEQNGEGCHEVI